MGISMNVAKSRLADIESVRKSLLLMKPSFNGNAEHDDKIAQSLGFTSAEAFNNDFYRTCSYLINMMKTSYEKAINKAIIPEIIIE